MTRFTDLLSQGSLRSDGFANEVVRIVSEHIGLLPDLVDALGSDDPSTRGHAADAFEKVSRRHPGEAARFLSLIAKAARFDEVPMVRWHMAMILGHLSVITRTIPRTRPALLAMLGDPSPFVRSWAIASLCVIAKRSAGHSQSIVQAVSGLTSDPSPAVAKRARTAVRALSSPGAALPRTWIKGVGLPPQE